MREKNTRMTTAQFAGLHGVNKRTLHYYDSIGLFSPEEKGENQYRYYGAAQSLDFEYIRMLKELNMSIEEILEYRKSPGSRQFLALAEQKLEEIDREIQKLKQTRRVLEEKKGRRFYVKLWERRRYVWKAAGIYEKMLKYAKERDLTLGGYAYEMGDE